MTFRERAGFQVQSAANPLSLLVAGFSAGINQWRDHPSEWGQGMSGYGRRFGYRLARHGVSQGIEFGVGAVLGEDPRYHPSNRAGFWPRTWYAVSRSFVARRNGGNTFAFSRMAGHYGSAFIANTWLPERLTQPGDALARGTVSIGWDAAKNVFLEFWPDLKRKFFQPKNRR